MKELGKFAFTLDADQICLILKSTARAKNLFMFFTEVIESSYFAIVLGVIGHCLGLLDRPVSLLNHLNA